KEFAVSRARDRASRVVCISAPSNNRRVTDSSAKLSRFASGRGCGSQISVSIEPNRTNCSVKVLIAEINFFVTVTARLLRGFQFLKGVPTLLSEKIFCINELNTLLFREIFRASGADYDVWRFLHHQARKTDRIFDVLHASHRSGLERPAIHDRRIHLVD